MNTLQPASRASGRQTPKRYITDRAFPFALLLASVFSVLATSSVLASEAPADPPCPPINMTNAVDALSSPCSDPALACSHDSGCVGAIFNFLAPQFEANRADFNASLYADVTPEWVVGCTAPTLEAWLDAVPIATFMELQNCQYDGYLAQFPELAALDFSSVSPSDFMRYMPPGMLMDILRRRREQSSS